MGVSAIAKPSIDPGNPLRYPNPMKVNVQYAETHLSALISAAGCPILDAQFYRAAGWGIARGSARPSLAQGRDTVTGPASRYA